MSERKLHAWQQAGLIDADTAARIRLWEADNSRPLGIWALVGLGALTVGLGILSVVAANWDDIAGDVRLAIHFALMAALAAFLWWRLEHGERLGDYFADSLMFILSTLGLTFFGHIGQVYQTSAPLWQPLLAWLIIFSPLLLIFGRGWPVAGMWMAGLLGTAWAHANEYTGMSLFGHRPMHDLTVYWGLICCPPMLVAALAAYMRDRSTRPQYWRLLEQLAVMTILSGISIVIIVRGWDFNYRAGSAIIHSFAIVGAAAVIRYARPTASGKATALMLAASAAVNLASVLFFVRTSHSMNSWSGALLFILLWGTVAYAALLGRWRRMFQLAITALAIRIIVLSFELSDNLLDSGMGLILSGIFAMGIGWITIRISRRYAPARGEIA